MMEISIRQLGIEDWQLFKEIRLKALKSDPAVFSATYAEAIQKSDQSWKDSITDQKTAIFGVFDSNQCIGMTGIAIDGAVPDDKEAFLWGSWLETSYRGKGISKLMYDARLEWAKNHPTCQRVTVGHRMSNIASKMANQKFGFVHTHVEEDKVWPDGKTEPMAMYKLYVKQPEPS